MGGPYTQSGEEQEHAAPVSRVPQAERGRELERHTGREPRAVSVEGATGGPRRGMPRDETQAIFIAVGIALLTLPVALLRLPTALAALALVLITGWAELRVNARRALTIAAYVAFFTIGFQVLTAVVTLLMGGFLIPLEELATEHAAFEPTVPSFVIIGAEVVALLATALAFPRIQRRLRFTVVPTLSTLGLRLSAARLLEAGSGALVGAAAVGVLVAGLHVGGGLKFGDALESSSAGPPLAALLAGYAVLLLAIAVCEEVALRGFALQNLGLYVGPVAAVGISSLITAVLHTGNPSFSPVSVVGLLLLGVVLASAYLSSGSLWMPIGLHFGWNFAMGPVFGLNVSGLRISGLLHAHVSPDRTLWTGGDFGPEGGLGGVICLALLAVCLTTLARSRRRSTQAGDTSAS